MMEVSFAIAILLAFCAGGFFLMLQGISDLLGKQKYSPCYRFALGLVIFLCTFCSIYTLGKGAKMPLEQGIQVLVAYMYLWIPLLVWDLAWKGVALWRAGRNAHLAWFICLFIFNTVGILPIIYIFAFSRKKKQSQLSS